MKKAMLNLLRVLAWAIVVVLWIAIEILLLLSLFSVMAYSVVGLIPLIIVNALLILAIIYRKKIKMRLLTSVVCATIAGVLISSITYIGTDAYSRDFTPEKWKNYPAGRDAMVEDLEKEHDLVGMTKNEIIELLGEPNHTSQFLYGYETYEYYNHHKYGVGYRYRVNFDKTGTVTSASYELFE